MDGPKHPVTTVDRTLQIVETIQDLDGAGVSEIAERVDVGKSAVHNHLTTLENREYVVKEGDEYHIGLAFLGLGAYARQRNDIYRAARDEVEALAEETGKLVNLLVEKNGMGIYLYQAKGDDAVELDTYVGKRVHLHCTASGKAMLGFRPDEEVERVLEERGMPEMTAETITDPEAFADELETVRDQGYATELGEAVVGVRAISVPIRDGDGVHGAVTVGGPSKRMSGDWFRRDLPERLLRTSNVIEVNFSNVR